MATLKTFVYLLLGLLLAQPSLQSEYLRLRQISSPPAPPSPPTPSPPPPSSPPPSSPPPPSPPPPPPSSHALLSDIALSSGTLVPSFNESTFTYTASVDSSVYELQVNVTVSEDEVAAGYGVNVNGTWVETGAAGPTLELSEEGETVAVSIYLLSIGYIPSLYTIYVTRESSSSGGGGGLSAWYIALIVVASVVVLALVAYALYWAYLSGWLPCFPASNSTGDYRSISS